MAISCAIVYGVSHSPSCQHGYFILLRNRNHPNILQNILPFRLNCWARSRFHVYVHCGLRNVFTDPSSHSTPTSVSNLPGMLYYVSHAKIMHVNDTWCLVNMQEALPVIGQSPLDVTTPHVFPTTIGEIKKNKQPVPSCTQAYGATSSSSNGSKPVTVKVQGKRRRLIGKGPDPHLCEAPSDNCKASVRVHAPDALAWGDTVSLPYHSKKEKNSVWNYIMMCWHAHCRKTTLVVPRNEQSTDWNKTRRLEHRAWANLTAVQAEKHLLQCIKKKDPGSKMKGLLKCYLEKRFLRGHRRGRWRIKGMVKRWTDIKGRLA